MSIYTDNGKKIRDAYLKFKNETKFKLSEACGKLTGRGTDYSQMAKWIPSLKVGATTVPIKTIEKLVELVERIDKVLKAEGYLLLDAFQRPLVSPFNDPMCVYDEQSEKLRYKKAGTSAGSDTSFDKVFGIKEQVGIEKIFPYTDSYLLRYMGGRGKLITWFLYVNEGEKKVLVNLPGETAMVYGSYNMPNEKTAIIHLETENKDIYCQMIFAYSKKKGFMLGTFSKFQRDSWAPTSGNIVVIRKSLITPENILSLYHCSEFFLLDSRREVNPGKYSIDDIVNRNLTDETAPIRFFCDLKDYVGTYEGFFINPHRKQFENCQINIYASGRVKMWVSASIKNPYLGVVRKVHHPKNLLFLKYQVVNEIADYRMYITLDTSGSSGMVYTDTEDTDTEDHTMYGILGGIERDVVFPAATRIALRKISDEIVEEVKTVIKPKVTPLDAKTKLKALIKRLDELKLRPFFYGITHVEYSSIAVLRAIDPDGFRDYTGDK